MAFFASVCIYCYFPFPVFHIKFYRWLLNNWLPVSPWLLTHVPSLNVKLHQWSQTAVFEVNRREMKRRLADNQNICCKSLFNLGSCYHKLQWNYTFAGKDVLVTYRKWRKKWRNIITHHVWPLFIAWILKYKYHKGKSNLEIVQTLLTKD